MFSAWLAESGEDVNFENKPVEILSQLLRRFYGEVRDQKGNRYNHNTLRGIRSAISRHLQNPPYNKKIDIQSNIEFKQANFVFDGYLKENKRQGKDKTKHKDHIEDEDWKQLHKSEAMSGSTL